MEKTEYKKVIKLLTPMDLENVTGGEADVPSIIATCPFCKEEQRIVVYRGARAICRICKQEFTL